MTRLVLLPGWGMGPATWRPLTERLPAAWRFRTPVLAWRPQPAGAAGLDGWLEPDLPAGVWVGWSLGGLLALWAAHRAPGRVRALIWIAATPRFLATADWPGMAPETFAGFAQGFRADPVAGWRRFLALLARGDRDGARLRRRLARLAPVPALDPAALDAGLAALQGQDLRPQFTGLQCPCLCLLGSGDALIPIALARALRALRPGVRVVRLAGRGHAPHLSDPERVAAEIRSFLEAAGHG